ncbi:hypothetical protein M6B38_320460 [Iris pallida]|uniref:Uncharacterized protein n=1 Tax=Iris pallida TaxID=29817 RepID=A0AAX6HD42_IRIPA|nr:hypothetical protein M6B38_320460 [Iris pallida]
MDLSDKCYQFRNNCRKLVMSNSWMCFKKIYISEVNLVLRT